MKYDTEFFEWVEAHKDDDTARLRLKYGRERADEILQIECRRKYGAKLGDVLSERPMFVFATALSGEQSTSWRLAQFHAAMVAPGSHVADLTAGLGIDAYAMSRHARVTAIERDPAVAGALRHNYADVASMTVIEADCRDFVRECIDKGETFDAVFIDPARRDAGGGRVFALDGCEPDVTAMMPDLLRMARKVIVKASPMLDITHTLGELPQAVTVIALGTTTECKELDIVCLTDVTPVTIQAVTLGSDFEAAFSFSPADETMAGAKYAIPVAGDYVFDPYPAVMKSGAMRLLGQRYGLAKLAANTHLWTGKEAVDDFPGHRFVVEEVLPYASKHIKRYASRYPRVSLTTRNFDVAAPALKSKLGVVDGSDVRLFAVTAQDGSKLLVTCRPD
ncbi:MAG: class I SAM-dependent methyltransferase [Bacteroidales bacterium]|nr:class I SAM-dependent methyltransferase [Bacteroidales bacterium]